MEPARTPQQVFTVVEGGSPGHMMRTARERLGLSIDDVCANLKMMPAQVRSMEADSLDGLPPGGYARAFIKGYARFLGLDADQVVASLVALNSDRKDVAGLPPIKVSPTVAAQREADAEEEAGVPASRREAVAVNHNFGQLIHEPGTDSRLVKYSLVALVIGLLVYLVVPGGKNGGKSEMAVSTPTIEAPVAPPPVMAERIPAGQPGALPSSGAESAFPPGTVMVPAQPTEPPAGSVQVLPAPIAAAPVAQSAPSAPIAQPVAPVAASPAPQQTYTPPQASAVKPAPAAPVASQPVQSKAAAPLATAPAYQSAPAASAPVSQPAPVASAPALGPQRIRMVFSDRAYITIRDRDGHVLMAQLNAGNTEKTVEGNPPFKVIIGNARAVKMEYRGRSFDLAPHTKDDVARFVME